MQVVVIKKEKIYKHPFPTDFNNIYWIKDYDQYGNEKDLISLEKVNDSWVLTSNDDCKIIENNFEVTRANVTINKFYLLKINNNGTTTGALIYIHNEDSTIYETYQIKENGIYTIGRAQNQNIILNNYVNDEHAVLIKENNRFRIQTKDTRHGIYVNNQRVIDKYLSNGDIVFIMGYKIIILNSFIIISSTSNTVKINSQKIVKAQLPIYNGPLEPTIDDENAELNNENDYYSRTPRFVTSIDEEVLKIDNPPGKIEPDDTPLLYTVGPMLTMAMSSVVSASVSVINLLNGNGTLLSVLPAIVVSVAMMASTLLWPSLMRKYNNKKQLKKEAERQQKYIQYLNEKRNSIETSRNNQYQVLIENFPEPETLPQIILNRKRNLWERQIKSDDFLNVRLGLGTIPLKLKLEYQLADFSMIDDNLKDELEKLVNCSKEINKAPVTINLTKRNKMVLIGEKNNKESMLKSLILQLVTYHSYEDLKLVFMINDNQNSFWEGIKNLPHLWTNSRDIRFYADNYEDMSKLSFYLEQVFNSRKYTDDNGKQIETNIDYHNVKPYYLIVVDNIKKNKNIEIIKQILKEENNLGFGLLILNDKIGDLPNECTNFLTADGKQSAILTNDLNKNNQQIFEMDKTDNIDLELMSEKLSNIPIKTSEVINETKSHITFLEMYKAGKIEQLNISERWMKNNPVNSLSVPIGMHIDGEMFNLDLHEKFHGPHGLIAGMTGSGKSEFIITYILSMCLNFSPEEVSFVLIDYKGGGLTGAFENKATGMRLPHLAGTITNLDKAEINRSLASIQSELKRRQELFNKAKVELNESTIDIYKYQNLYRNGRIKEPISHLFIISDEFAELKSQQPDFMNELISTARIGRSLGVHLILATQKPSGIVDDQIWSNSKFKICLKVQEKADSMDVIKCADAANLKTTGRFYLQVGYNDYFAMGQSAYTGAKYIPRDKFAKSVDKDIAFINNIGDTIKTIEIAPKEELVSMGEELPNILKYIYDAAQNKKMIAKRLWLDKIEPEIFVNDLIEKYNFKPEKWNIIPIIGEYDDPNNQNQELLTLDFNNNGNTLIYGVQGKEIMLTTMIYSLILYHTPEEINFYILDFGTETLGMFKDAPQVGDVVYINETEKLVNLFSTLNSELERRKKLFVEYNGNYSTYIKNSSKTLPRYVVIINNYEIFAETYDDYVDIVSSITREGERFGISFVITATGTNAIRGKTSQNFGNILCLDFNNPNDYSSLLGITHGMVPSDIIGRGLIKLKGELYEYQTAYPCNWDDINNYIKNTCLKLNNVINSKAEKIAILPNHVRLSDIESKISDIKNVPIGIEKNSLEISTFNFAKDPISLISTQDVSLLDNFIPSLGQVLQKTKDVELYLLDANEVIKDPTTFNNYYSKNFTDYLNKLEEISNNDNGTINMFLIFGLDTFKSGLDLEYQNKLKTLLLDIKSKPHIKVILADAISKIKASEYEDYYRTNVQPIYATWIGSGLTDQYTIKSSTYNKETRAQIPNDFGYNVDRGNAKQIKVLDFYSNE